MSRLKKGLSLLRNSRGGQRAYFPRPWDRPVAPYYLVTAGHSVDDRCGYARRYHFDDDGVPYRDTDEGRKYEPLVVARYALAMWGVAALTGDRNAQRQALQVMPWLIESAGPECVWATAATPINARERTPSAIVQGSVISALARFAAVVHDSHVERVIRIATERLVAPVERNGTLDVLPEGPFLEEFSSCSHVLNGCVYGLFALYDVIDGCGHDDAASIATAVESTLMRSVHRFSTSYGWSLYALDSYGVAPLSSLHYHESHIRLFTVLGQRTNAAPAWNAVDRWAAAMNRPLTRAAVTLAKSVQVIWMRDIRRLPLHADPA